MLLSKKFALVLVALSFAGCSSFTSNVSREPANDRFGQHDPIPLTLFQPRPGKHTACFLTINSVEEKGVFTKYLNPDDWDLVELTPTDKSANTSRSSWFDVACHSGVKCDINVISGHFAGQFFGQSGLTLGLSELETHSCAEDCDGILKNPREVYLFGCNTLAGKADDHRVFPPPNPGVNPNDYQTRYRDVLISDGYGFEAATRVAEDRYGPFGQDNQGKMRRSFQGVPYIYGFSSVSPLGADNMPTLEKYMKKLGSYTKHFESIATGTATALTAPNSDLASAMANSGNPHGKNFTQCDGLSGSDASSGLPKEICALFDSRISMRDRMVRAEVLMNSRDVLTILPSLQNFIYAYMRPIQQEADLFKRLQANANAKKVLLDTIASVKPSITQIQWTRFAYVMNWIGRDAFYATAHALVDTAFSEDGFRQEMADTICSMDIQDLNRQDFTGILGKLKPQHFTSLSASLAMNCIGLPRYADFRRQVRDFYHDRNSPTSVDTSFLTRTFSGSDPVVVPNDVDRELLAKTKAACAAADNYDCTMALASLGASDLDTVNLVIARYRRSGGRAQMEDAGAFSTMTVGLDLLEDTILASYFDPNQTFWGGIQAYFYAHPISKPENQSRVLAYITAPKDGRRVFELIYGLRTMKLPESQLSEAFGNFANQPFALNSGRVLVGFLDLADTAEASAAFIQSIFTKENFTSLSDDENLQAFYDAIKLPRIHAAISTSLAAQQAVCAINARVSADVGTNRYGEHVMRSVALKSCANLVAGD
jgi:hypothetical protein